MIVESTKFTKFAKFTKKLQGMSRYMAYYLLQFFILIVRPLLITRLRMDFSVFFDYDTRAHGGYDRLADANFSIAPDPTSIFF